MCLLPTCPPRRRPGGGQQPRWRSACLRGQLLPAGLWGSCYPGVSNILSGSDFRSRPPSRWASDPRLSESSRSPSGSSQQSRKKATLELGLRSPRQKWNKGLWAQSPPAFRPDLNSVPAQPPLPKAQGSQDGGTLQVMWCVLPHTSSKALRKDTSFIDSRAI